MTGRPAPAVRLRRTYSAPPAVVYRAWLDPAVLRVWLSPGTFHADAVEVDERVGGRFRVQHRDESGADVGGSESTIVELVPDERIVLRWRFVGPDRAVADEPESMLTVSFAPSGDGGTVLELVHEQLDELRARRPDIADSVELGWRSVLELLGSTLASPH